MKFLYPVIALALVTTACSQNPHVLGVDPKLNDRIQGPDVDNGGEWGEEGDKNGKKDGKKECFEVAVTRVFKSRDLTAEEAAQLPDEKPLAIDVMLPPPSRLREVTSAEVRFRHPGALTDSSEASLCLAQRGVCLDLVSTEKPGTLNLLARVGAGSLATTVYANPTLYWYNDGEAQITEAELVISTVEERCSYDPPALDPKGDGKDGKNGEKPDFDGKPDQNGKPVSDGKKEGKEPRMSF